MIEPIETFLFILAADPELTTNVTHTYALQDLERFGALAKLGGTFLDCLMSFSRTRIKIYKPWIKPRAVNRLNRKELTRLRKANLC